MYNFSFGGIAPFLVQVRGSSGGVGVMPPKTEAFPIENSYAKKLLA